MQSLQYFSLNGLHIIFYTRAHSLNLLLSKNKINLMPGRCVYTPSGTPVPPLAGGTSCCEEERSPATALCGKLTRSLDALSRSPTSARRRRIEVETSFCLIRRNDEDRDTVHVGRIDNLPVGKSRRHRRHRTCPRLRQPGQTFCVDPCGPAETIWCIANPCMGRQHILSKIGCNPVSPAIVVENIA